LIFIMDWTKLSPLENRMPKAINIHEAKTHLSRLLEQVAAGEEVIIAKAGKPLARLVPLANAARPKKLGQLKGKITVPDDFNAPLDAGTLALFQGG
jgi:prevent-host-death family protein